VLFVTVKVFIKLPLHGLLFFCEFNLFFPGRRGGSSKVSLSKLKERGNEHRGEEVKLWNILD